MADNKTTLDKLKKYPLASDFDAVVQIHRVATIASKPAPTIDFSVCYNANGSCTVTV